MEMEQPSFDGVPADLADRTPMDDACEAQLQALHDAGLLSPSNAILAQLTRTICHTLGQAAACGAKKAYAVANLSRELGSVLDRLPVVVDDTDPISKLRNEFAGV